MDRKRHWFHCSSEDHGKRFFAVRRLPSCTAAGEPPTPRLCVTPTIAGCFAARLFNLHSEVCVYATENKIRGIFAPKSVWDRCITREHWLVPVPPIKMTLVKAISPDTVDEICFSTYAYIHLMSALGRTGVPWRVRVAQYAQAVKVLGAEDRTEERWVKLLCKRAGIHCDPSDYLFREADREIAKFEGPKKV